MRIPVAAIAREHSFADLRDGKVVVAFGRNLQGMRTPISLVANVTQLVVIIVLDNVNASEVLGELIERDPEFSIVFINAIELLAQLIGPLIRLVAVVTVPLEMAPRVTNLEELGKDSGLCFRFFHSED